MKLFPSGLLVLGATLALYIRTAAPTLGGTFDSEEFQHAAYSLGLAHAPGYPLYLLVGKIFTTLVPLGNVAYRMNLLNAFIGAGAATLIFFIAAHLTRNRIVAILTAALFATNSAVWRQSGVASAAPLNFLLTAALIYALLLWRARRAPLAAAAFLFGLNLAHHHTPALLAPAIVVFVWLCDPALIRRPREIARLALVALAPLTFYLYIPLRGGALNQIIAAAPNDFIRTAPNEIFSAALSLAVFLNESFTPLGVLFVALGALLARTQLKDSRVALFLGLATLTYLVIGVLYGGEPDRYQALPFFFLVFWFAIGAAALAEFITARFPRARAARAALYFALTLTIAVPFDARWRVADWSAFDRMYKQWDEIFSLPIPPNATLVGNWSQINAMYYFQRVENRRADVRVVGTLYDIAPQTDAARITLAEGRAFFLAPSIALPSGSYRYALLGPLLEIRAAPRLQMPPTRVEKNLRFTDALTLVDYELSVALEPYPPRDSILIQPTRTLRVAALWRAEARPRDFLARVQLYDPDARLIAQRDEPSVRGLERAAQWQRGEYVSDVYNFLIPGGTISGAHEIFITVLDAETKTPIGEKIRLDSIRIARNASQTREQVFIQHPLEIVFDARLALWGYGAPARVAAGDAFQFNLLWAVQEKLDADAELRIGLVDASGKIVAASRRSLSAFYPSREWQAGEKLKAYYDLRVPADAAAGEYALMISVEADGKNWRANGREEIILTRMQVVR